ncbi:hypothetical protein [Spongiactinospora sp. 9N601]|uniref:hypothetical protein n=1 Tax=Spongiactinospora sp. 9N601 TaxID=3375149 RepID=UPI0037906A06
MAITRLRPERVLRGWPVWTAYAALGWSVVYAALGVFWAAGGGGFPFGAADVNAEGHGRLLAGATAQVTGPVMAGLGTAGAVIAWAMARRARGPRPVLLLSGWGLAVLLTLVLPEIRALHLALFPLIFLTLDKMDWPTVNFLILMAGGFAWAAATLAYQRASRSACAHCGRRAGHRTGRGAAWLVRHRRALTYTAVAAPWGYAVVRLAWVLDIPLGVPAEFLRHLATANGGAGAKGMELILIGMCAAGSVLTAGLVHRWGEVWPRWVVGLAGRPVPVAVPVVCAGLAACATMAVGLSWARGLPDLIAGGWSIDVYGYRVGPVFALPIPSFLLWGGTLGLAALACYYRRRGECRHCAAAITR